MARRLGALASTAAGLGGWRRAILHAATLLQLTASRPNWADASSTMTRGQRERFLTRLVFVFAFFSFRASLCFTLLSITFWLRADCTSPTPSSKTR